MRIEKYLRRCNVSSVEELTDTQIIAYFEKCDNLSAMHIRCALECVKRGEVDKSILLKVLKKVLEDAEKRKFVFITVEREGVVFAGQEIGPDYNYILGYIENGERVTVETC